MTVREAAEVRDWIERLYWSRNDELARKETTLLWAAVFVDYERPVVEYAVMMYIKRDRKGWPPMPGQVMGEIEELENRLYVLNLTRNQHRLPGLTLGEFVRLLMEEQGIKRLKGADESDKQDEN